MNKELIRKFNKIDRELQKMLGDKYDVFQKICMNKSHVKWAENVFDMMIMMQNMRKFDRDRPLVLNRIEQAIRTKIKNVEDSIKPSANFLIFALLQEIEMIYSKYGNFESKFYKKFATEYARAKGADLEEIKEAQKEILDAVSFNLQYEAVFQGKILEKFQDTCSWLAGASTKLVYYNEMLYNTETVSSVLKENVLKRAYECEEKYLWLDHCKPFTNELKLWNELQARVEYIESLLGECFEFWDNETPWPVNKKKKDRYYLLQAVGRAKTLQSKLRLLLLYGNEDITEKRNKKTII